MKKEIKATQHTPGPWILYSAHPDEQFIDVNVNEGRNRPVFKIEPYKDIPEPEARRNARLIAAAPELLEALIGLAKEIDLSKLNVRKDFSLMNYHNAALKAIAKAEGKTEGRE